ncbi:HAD family hydrolase [Desulfoluna spongiiphila]|uniref:phosphoglycolate phosphatase n=1 Tax=Desulfoluna spongiiphila TaxID=419481 RepID=A0A1G5DJ34_9BACT|nr:HAD family hydrolase [Desulfoluna spongiiphila]SCY14571.1 Phosphoglycolate phosphatase, HAD superfamily [Desulfoluna spongiiphila]VVS95109.1 c1.5: had beta-pgm phosphatase like [Desulfoluna spongiiphila]
MAWQGVFFDFDGVIVDSVPVKTEAFARMFRGFGPEIEAQVVAHHLAHGGVSRFVKFRYYYEELLHKAVGEDELARLGREFSQMVRQGVLTAPLIPGALESLAILHWKRVPAFVVSGTPCEEVRDIVEARGLVHWFMEVHGSPLPKHVLLRGLQARYRLAPSACLMIGDAMTDYHAATATDTCFLGIVPQGQASPFPPDTPVSAVVSIP